VDEAGATAKTCGWVLNLLALLVQKSTETDLAEGAARRGARAQRADGGDLAPRCQYLYFCTSKASKLPVKQGGHT
jgi:hypothetical protein